MVFQNYVSLFQKVNSDIQSLVENDDPLDDMDDGMFPEDMSIFKMEQRQKSVRARVACDQLIGAIPDAIAQALHDAFCKSSKKMVDRFTSENMKKTLYDVCSVLISGMRPTIAHVKHWMNEQDRQKARTNALGGSQLLGDSAKLGVSRRSSGGLGSRNSMKRGSNRRKKNRNSSNFGGLKKKNSTGSVAGSVVGDGSNPATGLGGLFRKNVEKESMPLNSTRQTTRCRLQLGNSRLVHAYLKRHEAIIATQPLQLKMTMTTHQDRVELTKTIPEQGDLMDENIGGIGGGAVRDENEEMLEWATGQSLRTRMARKDEWELHKEQKPKTVRSAVKEFKKRQDEIKRKHAKSQITYKREVRKSIQDLDQAFKMLELEQSQVTVGDVNEWANQFTDRKLLTS